MTGFTASEMADILGLKLKTVKKRLETADIKPLTKEAVYPASALDAIREVPGRGRPKKEKP
jgi:predicted ArsR family transcriptional regulator